MRLRSVAAAALVVVAACDQTIDIPLDPLINLTIVPSFPPTMDVGQSLTLVGIVQGSSNQSVTWTSSNPAVAPVDAVGVVRCVAAGTVTITGTAAADGTTRRAVVVTCRNPVQIQVNTTSLAFTHTVGSSPCPQAVGSVQVTNTSAVAVGVVLTGHSALSVDTASFTLEPGASRTVTLSFNCSTQTSFSGTVTFTASGGGTTDVKTVAVAGTIVP